MNFDLYNSDGKLEFGRDWGVNHFPDGQQGLWATQPYDKVVCAITNPADLDLFLQIGYMMTVLELQINYAYGSRSDKFGETCSVNGTFWSLVDEFYESAKVRVLDPHGTTQAPRFGPEIEWPEYDLIVYPDKSAQWRQCVNAPDCASTTWEKERDQETGRIVKHFGPDAHGLKVIVMDDLCDGGATFVSMASAFDSPDLYVTHGIFSKGLKPLADAGYKNIITTNSYNRELVSTQCDGLNLIVHDVWAKD